MTQIKAFWESEGDAWFQRNRGALKTAANRDWPLRIIEDANLRPNKVLEVGCANGWRLDIIAERYGCRCYGIDVSQEAVESRPQLWAPNVIVTRSFIRGAHKKLPSADLVICHFVMHWVDRQDVLGSLASIDDLVDNRGFLIIGDFMPSIPTEVPYHHREGLFTYKADYISPFLAAGYRLRKEVIFNHDTGEQGEYHTIPDNERAHCTLLQKVYQR